MNNSDRYDAEKLRKIFNDSINNDDGWTRHNEEKPEPDKACWVLIFELAPFISIDYQIRVMTYDSVDDVYIDVINGLKMKLDSPVCTYWKYVRK